MIRLPAVILAALLLVVAVPAQVDAKPAPDAPTIIVQWDADVPAVWPRNAPDMWEKGTGLRLNPGTCSGALCIQVHTDANGTACGVGAAGCSGDIYSATFPDLHVQTCHVWLSNHLAETDLDLYFTMDPGIFRSVAGHEVGHCLGLGHSSDPNSIMYSPQDSTDAVTRPTRTDLRAVAALWENA